MAHPRLTHGVIVTLCFFAVTAVGQSQNAGSAIALTVAGDLEVARGFAEISGAEFRETPNLEGILLHNSLGEMYAPEDDPILTELASDALIYGFPKAEDLELVNDANGVVIGFYRVDNQGFIQFGTIVDEDGSSVGKVAADLELDPRFKVSTDLSDVFTDDPDEFLNGDSVKIADPLKAILPAGSGAGLPTNALPYFEFDIIRDIEIASDWSNVTNGYGGLVLLDGAGGIHAIGNVNLPKYAGGGSPAGGEDLVTPYPEALLVSSAPAPGEIVPEVAADSLDSGSGESPVAIPIFTYFGFDIARDLEVSSQYVRVSDPISDSYRTVAMMNGYYILDGNGAVHSCRLPLDFDPTDDGFVTEADVDADGFGQPINNRPLAPPWPTDNLPYFGFDIAEDIEMTASGNGLYLLDAFGAVHMIGDAHRSFPNSTTTYFGFDVARDLAIVPNLGEDDNGDGSLDRISTANLGLYVLDAYGVVHVAGNPDTITDFGINDQPVAGLSPVFNGLEISPAFHGVTKSAKNFGYVIVEDTNNDGVFSFGSADNSFVGDESHSVGTDFTVK